jgi:hypothetical protein
MFFSVLILLAGSLFMLPGFASAYTKAVVDFPVLGYSDSAEDIYLSEDIYLYSCTDATCASTTQLQDYGHITNVHRWPKSLGGPGGPVPATWVFLTLTDNQAQYFEFWQESPQGWQSCVLGITADGDLDTANTTCVGVVATPAQGTDGVPQFSMGVAMFKGVPIQTDPSPNDINTLPARGLTFTNETSAATICLQTDSSFDHDACDGANKISRGSSYVIDGSDLVTGANSEAGQIVAYQLEENYGWVNTGRDETTGTVYATKLEWTMWPEQDQFTPGPTTIDISLVDGFNCGASLVPDRDTVCSVADTEGGKPYFVLYKANAPMAVFPESSDLGLEDVCPAEHHAPDGIGTKTGCYSSCAYANIHNENINETCCYAGYHSAVTCTLPPTLPYTMNIDESSTRVYSWAFEDWRGTFTCEPTAKFTFKILNPPL